MRLFSPVEYLVDLVSVSFIIHLKAVCVGGIETDDGNEGKRGQNEEDADGFVLQAP
jgi:hypothetical protein